MKIKLIQPARKPEWGDLQEEVKTFCNLLGFKAPLPLLSLPTIAACTPFDVEVVITDENAEEIDFDEDVDLVGITGMTCVIPRAYEIADEYRKRGVPVVMGGIHVSMLPEEAIQHCDSVVIGEAEEIWEQVVRDAQKKRLKEFYQPERFPDLSKSPIPRWDLLDNKQYIVFPLQAGRGCPFDCDFCSVKVFNGRQYRHKSIEQVVKEVEVLQKIAPKATIFICDDNLLAVPEYAKRLLKKLVPLKMKFWTCQVSLNRLKNDKLLGLMRKAGCMEIDVGFESVSQKSLDVMNKGQVNRVKDYKEIIDKVYSSQIAIKGNFILGSDGDEESIFEETAKFIDQTNITFPYITIMTPLPGTNLYKRLDKQKRLIHKEWEKYDVEHLVFKPYLISEDRLRQGWEYVIKNVYSYDNLYKKLSYLWDKKIWTGDDTRYFNIKKRVLLSTLRNHLHNADSQRRNFVAKCLKERNDMVAIYTIIHALSYHDWGYRQ